MPHLRHQIHGQVATIVLDNPPQNRIGDQMIDELAAAIDAIGRSDGLRRADSRRRRELQLRRRHHALARHQQARAAPRFERDMSVFNQFERLPLPVIAAVEGLCFGGGLELALRADVIFASASAAFGHPEQTLGIVTLLGGIYRVAERVGRARASEWALTSEKVPAATMERLGLVNRVIEDTRLMDEASAFAEKLAQGSHTCVRSAQGIDARVGPGRCGRCGRSDVRHRDAAVRYRRRQAGPGLGGRCTEGRQASAGPRLQGALKQQRVHFVPRRLLDRPLGQVLLLAEAEGDVFEVSLPK